MTRRRIVHVIPTLDQSGAEKQLALLAAHLPRDRFDVSVCALTRGGYFEPRLREAGIAVDVLGKRLKWDPFTLHALVRYLGRTKPDLVQTWLFAGDCYGSAAARLARVPRIVCSRRCVDVWKSGVQLRLDRLLDRRADAVVANTRAVADFYQANGTSAQKIRVIPNAVDDSAAANGSNTDAVRRELGLDPSRATLAFVGRLWPQKRVRNLIWALDVLRVSGWKLQLVIAGEGPERPALERFTRQLQLESVVRFLGHREDVPELLRVVDLVVLPSRFEGVPNVVLEAMQSGVPVVATRIPGMDEVLDDGRTGLLVEPEQPIALARGIHALLRDPDRRSSLARQAAQDVRERFALPRMIAAYSELYDELLGA